MKYLQRLQLDEKLLLKLHQEHFQTAIIIPAYREEDFLLQTLESLQEASPAQGILVLVVLNHPASDSEEIKRATNVLYKGLLQTSFSNFKLIATVFEQENPKTAGVGNARKYGLDHVAKVFADRSMPEGKMICLDADSTVAKNYLQVLSHSDFSGAASIHFEHPASAADAVVDYELHLRCFIGMQRLQQLPFAYQTFGSAIAVRAAEYIKEGGMNTRKAGEDFYFLHKWSCKNKLTEILDTCVFPSGRVSDRVPFGTGKAVTDIKSSKKQHTYHPDSYKVFSVFPALLRNWYKKEEISEDNHLIRHLLQGDLVRILKDCKAHSKTIEDFTDRFFNWFNAFRFFKSMHYLRNFFPDVPVEDGTRHYFQQLELPYHSCNLENLKTLRSFDLQKTYHSRIKQLVAGSKNQ